MNKYHVASLTELKAEKKKIVHVNGMEIGVFYVNGQCYAWRNICPHAYAPVCEGRVCGTRLPSLVYEYIYGMEDQILRCPWHGWEFDLTTGEHLVDQTVRLRGYPVDVHGDDVYILMK